MNKFDGEGIVYFQDGNIFKGMFENNLKHGKGTLYTTNES